MRSNHHCHHCDEKHSVPESFFQFIDCTVNHCDSNGTAHELILPGRVVEVVGRQRWHSPRGEGGIGL